ALASLFLYSLLWRPPSSTLFPYTTLFRSLGMAISCAMTFASSSRVSTFPRTVTIASGASRGAAVTYELGKTTTSTEPWRSSSQRSEEHTSELQSPYDLVCRLLLEKKKKNI